MAAALRELPGNPSSPHGPGRAARAAIETGAGGGRRAHRRDGGGDRLHLGGDRRERPGDPRALLRGRRAAKGGTGRASARRVVAHRAPLRAGRARGGRRRGHAAAGRGRWHASTPAALRAALRPDTALVTLALANHELGNVYDVATLADDRARRAARCFMPTPFRRPGKIPVDVDALGVDALTLSAHKLHGPKGVGAIFLRRSVPFDPAGRGGHQERERRAGTENVAGIVGFGVAARLARDGARRQRARGSARCASASKRGCLRSPTRDATAIRRVRCPGRSTSASPVRPGSWSRRRSISKG